MERINLVPAGVERIIGIELRYRGHDGQGGQLNQEVAMIALHWDVPDRAPDRWHERLLPCTVHTSAGDINVTIDLDQRRAY